MPAKNALLFKSLKVRELELSNQIMISPKCTYQTELDGMHTVLIWCAKAQFALGLEVLNNSY